MRQWEREGKKANQGQFIQPSPESLPAVKKRSRTVTAFAPVGALRRALGREEPGNRSANSWHFIFSGGPEGKPLKKSWCSWRGTECAGKGF